MKNSCFRALRMCFSAAGYVMSTLIRPHSTGTDAVYCTSKDLRS